MLDPPTGKRLDSTLSPSVRLSRQIQSSRGDAYSQSGYYLQRAVRLPVAMDI